MLSPSMCTHFQRNLHCSLDRECSVLLAVPPGALLSLTLPNPATDPCAPSTGALSRAGTPFSFRSSACQPNRSSLFAAEGSRGSALFSKSQSSILLSPSFPLSSIIQQNVENLLLRVKSKACDECNSSWKHPSLGVSLC